MAFGIQPQQFWELSWHDCSIYMAAIRERHHEEELKQELEWARTRALWLPLMKAHFKKDGGGEYKPKDLITLSFDPPEEEEKQISFKEAKALYGSRLKKDVK